ncbi:MAG: FAD:protein FMN transferase [Bacteroidales bacterium]
MRRILFTIFLLSFFFAGCREYNIKFTGEAQGTYYHISYYDPLNRNLKSEIDSILTSYDKSVSIYENNSFISRFNRNEITLIDDSLFKRNLMLSKEISESTGGAFDPTIGPIANAWGFGVETQKNIKPEHLDSLKDLTGFDRLTFENNHLKKSNPGVEINFNAIAQGYSVDLISEYLESKGITNHLIDIGGEVITSGDKPGNEPWKVGIEKPASDKSDKRETAVKIILPDKAVATSGNYRKYYKKDGKKYSHTIDPKTGNPVTHNLLSVSVIADQCAIADAYATAFMVMGKDKSLQFVKDHPEKKLEVLLIYSGEDGQYRIEQSKGFQQYIVE